MSGLGVVVLSLGVTVAGLVAFGAVMLTPRTWRAPRPRPPKLPPAELARLRSALAAQRAAEVATLPHPLGWPTALEGGVLAARGPNGERHIFSVARCGWVRA